MNKVQEFSVPCSRVWEFIPHFCEVNEVHAMDIHPGKFIWHVKFYLSDSEDMKVTA